MINIDSAHYSGKPKEGGFSDFIANNNFFLAFEIEEGINSEQGKEILRKITEEAVNLSIQNLATFDQFITKVVTEYNFPSTFSLAAGFLKDKIMYLKTIGEGKIYLNRRDNFAQIIDKDNSASGFIADRDFYIFTTRQFVDLLGSDLELKTIFDHKSPREIVDDLSSQFKETNDQGVIALIVQYREALGEQVNFITADKTAKINTLDQIRDKAINFTTNFQEYSKISGKRKIFTAVAVAVILFIFIWSVVLGVQRRNSAEENRKIKLSKELINLKLNQAEDVFFLNLPRSMALLSEAKKEVEKLKGEIGSKKEVIGELENLIKSTENKIVKKEDKNYEEFYDLTLDSKEAKGNKIYLDKDNLSIVDQGKGTVYILSLSKKSLDKKNVPEIKKARGISSYQDYSLIYVEGEGFYKITNEAKAKKVIDKDKDWGIISDMWIYNANLYILDSGKGDVYKYLVTDNGYSEKNSYLKADAGSVKGANSLAIDSSVYIGLDDRIIKYTAGARDEFSTTWPEKNVRLNKIFTSPDVEKVYGWDKSKGAIYILSKNGTYERQINSGILAKASDFAVFDNSVFVLLGEKIYKINLE